MDVSSASQAFGLAVAVPVLFEIGMHVFIHYTVPGIQFGSWVAASLAPALDGAGIQTVFSETAIATAGNSFAGVTSAGTDLNALPSLSAG